MLPIRSTSANWPEKCKWLNDIKDSKFIPVPVHIVTKKEIKASVQALLAGMPPSASTSSFDSLSALLGAVTESTGGVHSPHGLVQRFQKQSKEKERSAPIRFLLYSLRI